MKKERIRLSRREFIKGSAAATGSLVAMQSFSFAQTRGELKSHKVPWTHFGTKITHQGARLIASVLESQGVEYVPGVPGQAIMPFLHVLRENGPAFLPCRHEGNAAFIAATIGCITGKAGVCVATAGPGAVNLVCGAADALKSGDPMVLLTGAPSHRQAMMEVQEIDTVSLFAPVTKSSVQVENTDSLCDTLRTAFQLAEEEPSGPVHVSVPMDILLYGDESLSSSASVPQAQIKLHHPSVGDVARLISTAELPVVVVGRRGGSHRVSAALRSFLAQVPLPTTDTYEAAGVLSSNISNCYCGRIGELIQWPPQHLLDQADLVITAGYSPSEADPAVLFRQGRKIIVHIDALPPPPDLAVYRPDISLTGDMVANLKALGKTLEGAPLAVDDVTVEKFHKDFLQEKSRGAHYRGTRVHPLRYIYEMESMLPEGTTVVSDVGTVGLWLANFYMTDTPRGFLLDCKKWATIGSSLAKAIGTTLVRPDHKVVCNIGDGSFLMCGMELETISRINAPIVTVVWNDGCYDKAKQFMTGHFGGGTEHFERSNLDFMQMAAAFGIPAHTIEKPDQIKPLLEEALNADGPVLIDLRIDYSQQSELYERYFGHKI